MSNAFKYMCPVCGKHEFPKIGCYEVCPVCGWQDDIVQFDEPDEENCSNVMSLNQAMRAWDTGREYLIKQNLPYGE